MKPKAENDTSSVNTLDAPAKINAPAMMMVRPIAYRGRFSRPESLPSSRVPGSSRSRALAQIARVTAVCTAIMLEVKPIARVMSRARPDPDPKACTRVVATGLASLPETDRGHVGDREDDAQRGDDDEHTADREREDDRLGQHLA